MSRHSWEDQTAYSSGSGRYDPSLTSLRGGIASRPQTPALSVYSDITPTPRHAPATAPSGTKKRAPGSKNAALTAQNLPHHKAGRVKVGIRIRPAFQEEMNKSKGPFSPIIEAQDNLDSNELGKVILSVGSGKQREFKFDYAFGPSTTQDNVYDRIARPVVSDVLSGFNGTIFAYGQTGTGKTYTMGILETVSDARAGIVPRSISQIFNYLSRQKEVEYTVSMSFIQIYRENIHDLLSVSIVNGQTNAFVEENLAIREDPLKGFYVEGLQEYVVRSYEEAEALVNLGLENRAIAATLMNSTSSRSHTVITLVIEQKGNIPTSREERESRQSPKHFPSSYHRVLRSKLLMVDLAGSERVRKTISKGTRLDEAKSINTSLSALGNVIAALAESNMTHVPYRDSKLTKILHDSLGGTASTSLVATVGPAPSHYNETLSTLQFGSRCMAVKSTPVQHEEVDFADMCARLQQQLSTVESQMNSKLNEQAEKYEATIRSMKEQIQKSDSGNGKIVTSSDLNSDESPSLSSILSYLEGRSMWDESEGYSWYKAARWVDENGTPTAGTEASVLLAYCFDALKKMHKSTLALIQDSKLREKEQEESLNKLLEEVNLRESKADLEKMAMANCDPARHLDSFDFVGSHLAQISKGTAFERINEFYNLDGESIEEREKNLREYNDTETKILRSITDYSSAKELAKSIDFMAKNVGKNIDVLYGNIDKKDLVLGNLKMELMQHMVDKRSREEEVVNWSYILKYLLANTSKLRSQLAEEQKRQTNAFSNGNCSIKDMHHMQGSTKHLQDKAELLLSSDGSDVEDDEEYVVPARAPVNIGINSAASTGKASIGKKSSKEKSAVDSNDSVRGSSQSQEHLLRSSIIATSNRSIHGEREVQEDRKRMNQAGKLMPRLQDSKKAVRHNAMVSSEIDQIGPPPRSDNEREHGAFQKTMDNTFPYHDTNNSSSSTSSQSIRHKQFVSELSTQKRGAPSNAFAKNVVKGLGVVGEEAEAAMTVIERVTQMSGADIARLDAETRQQVNQIRLELGIIDADDNERSARSGYDKDLYTSTVPTGIYTPSSNITMSDDDEAFSQLDNEEW